MAAEPVPLVASMSRKHHEPTVFIVDDDQGVRDYLQWLVESVGLRAESFPAAREFLDAYDPATPGCLVLDVRLPGLSGLDLQAELGRRNITLPIIMMTGYAEVPMAVRALKAGAHDFIQKPLDGQLLLDRVQQAIEADQKARQAHAGRTEVASHLAQLTPRQRQVLDGVLDGKPSKIIAAELGLSAKTVDVHRARIMEKLGAQSLPDLFRLVVLARGEKV